VDGEVVASDADGRPNFARLHLLRGVKQPTERRLFAAWARRLE